jgi:hypothetical protein
MFAQRRFEFIALACFFAPIGKRIRNKLNAVPL